MLRIRTLSLLVAGLLVSLTAVSAEAQGKGKGGKDKRDAHEHHGGHGDTRVVVKSRKPTKVKIDDRTIIVTREVLVEQGYEVVRIVPHDHDPDVRVVYFRRGNNGRGRGHGPVEMMIIRPTESRIVFEAAPSGVLVNLNLRLKL